jgi:hypothetical protein
MFLQVRSKISTFGGFGGPTEVTCGGNALKFYSSVRLNIKRIGFVKKGEEVQFFYHFSSIASCSSISIPIQNFKYNGFNQSYRLLFTIALL